MPLKTHIAGVRDKLAQKDLLVRVECVDDQGHQLSNETRKQRGESLRSSRDRMIAIKMPRCLPG